MIRVIAAFLVLGSTVLANCLSGQTLPQTAELHRCSLPSGPRLESCRVGYRVYGQQRTGNAILVPTWLGGKSSDWNGLLGPGRIIDTTRYYVVVVDALADGVSSSPSTTAGSLPQITIQDMVYTQYRLAREVLKLDHLRAVVGVSMGGIQAFEWAVAHPDFVDRFVSIVGTPQVARHDRAWLTTIVRLIDVGKTYHVPRDTVARLLAGVGVLVSDTQETINLRLPGEADSLLAESAAGMSHRIDFDDLAMQARAVLAYDFYKRPGSDSAAAAARMKGRFLVINSTDDRTVSAGPPLSFARRVGLDTLSVRSSCGHGVFGCEPAMIGAAVQAFLAR